jgi:alanyl-tRNA synthetase
MRLLGCEDRVLPELMPISRDRMGETYTDLHRDWERISTVAYAEEDAFRQTLRAGTQIFDLAHPRDGRRAGAVGRRGGLPAADDRAA